MATLSAPTRPSRWLALLPFLAAVAVVAVVGGLSASSSAETYRALELPPFAPPSWLFGPVWTVLYVAIAIAGWLMWRAGAGPVALGLWVVQLVLNMAWTPLFFAADRYGWALVDITALLITVVATIAVCRRASPAAAWLLAPYAVWVGFAMALNGAIVILN